MDPDRTYLNVQSVSISIVSIHPHNQFIYLISLKSVSISVVSFLRFLSKLTYLLSKSVSKKSVSSIEEKRAVFLEY